MRSKNIEKSISAVKGGGQRSNWYNLLATTHNSYKLLSFNSEREKVIKLSYDERGDQTKQVAIDQLRFRFL